MAGDRSGLMLPPSVAAQGACTTPELLPLVDAAFERPGGPAQRQLEAQVCPTCPIWRECLHDALKHHEHGPWGGTNARKRRRFVTPAAGGFPNMRDVIRPVGGQDVTRRVTPAARAPDRRIARLNELGVTSRDVKSWAVEQGLLPKITKGRATSDLIEEYAAAHDMSAA